MLLTVECLFWVIAGFTYQISTASQSLLLELLYAQAARKLRYAVGLIQKEYSTTGSFRTIMKVNATKPANGFSLQNPKFYVGILSRNVIIAI